MTTTTATAAATTAAVAATATATASSATMPLPPLLVCMLPAARSRCCGADVRGGSRYVR